MKLTRLDILRLRLEAQNACLAWAFDDIAARPGPVFELGLGHGRTYDHLRTHLPKREIVVFDREIDCFDDCTPPAESLVLGDMAETLPAAAARFGGTVVLAHSDSGSYDEAHNRAMRELLSHHLPPLLAPDGLVLSDLKLDLDGCRALPLPPGAMEGRYFIYRRSA